MINSKEFIVKQLDNMVSLFPFLKVKYEFEPIGMCHYIKVLPATDYHNNQEYIKFEMSLEDNFCSFYEEEDVCFLTEGSLFEITNPTYEKVGICYGETAVSQEPLIFEGYKFNFPTSIGFLKTGTYFNFSNSQLKNSTRTASLENNHKLEDQYSDGFYPQAA